jgi:MoxR-like ATPase
VFSSIEQVEKRLRDQQYICSRNVATVVYLATRLEKPVLVEGPAGVGKTELAKVVAGALSGSTRSSFYIRRCCETRLAR